MNLIYSIEIESTPEAVFNWIGSPEKAMQWMTSVTKTEMLHQTPEMVGSTFRETVAEGGKGIEMQGKVTGYQLNESISFHLESRVNQVDVKYKVEQTPNGARLTQDANVQWKFPVNLFSLFMGSKFNKTCLIRRGKSLAGSKRLSKGNSNQKP